MKQFIKTFETPEKYIVTHTSPDWDAIAAAWLLHCFVDPAMPVKFISAGDASGSGLMEKAYAVVDVGGVYDPAHGLFDHHVKGQEDTCATLQVAESLSQERDLSYLQPLLDMINLIDHGVADDKQTGLWAIMAGMPGADIDKLSCGWAILDALETNLSRRKQAREELAGKTVYRSADNQLVAIKHGSRQCTDMAFEQGARVVMFERASRYRRTPGRHTRSVCSATPGERFLIWAR